jgi:hypothetical protein
MMMMRRKKIKFRTVLKADNNPPMGLMLSGFMTGPRVCGYMHRRQVNTRKHKTELAYIGRSTSYRHAPSSLALAFPSAPLLFMPELRRRHAAALLQPADIPGLTHLQPIQVLMLSLGRNDVCVLCPLRGLWRPLIDQNSDLVFGFEGGA